MRGLERYNQGTEFLSGHLFLAFQLFSFFLIFQIVDRKLNSIMF